MHVHCSLGGVVREDIWHSAKHNFEIFPEFFEPHFMLNPPPMAEQFLHDLRRMIDIAKQKIQLRRHVPQLVSIPEEATENYQSYMELQAKNLSTPTNICTQSASTSDISAEESSPKSTKSSDSGRESMKDSDGSDPSMSPKESKKTASDEVDRNEPTANHIKPPEDIDAKMIEISSEKVCFLRRLSPTFRSRTRGNRRHQVAFP